MKTQLFAMLFFAIIISACNQDDGDTDNQLGTSTGYIEFKIDGKIFRIDDYNTGDGMGSVYFSNNPSLYQVIISFITASPSGSDNVSLHQISQSPLEAKNYEYDAFNINERPTFVQVLPTLFGYSITNDSRGFVNFSKFETFSGGKVEGTFQLTKLKYHDKDIKTISSNHNLTEGKFSVVVD